MLLYLGKKQREVLEEARTCVSVANEVYLGNTSPRFEIHVGPEVNKPKANYLGTSCDTWQI